VVAQLKGKGVVTRGWIGVQIQPVTDDIAESLGIGNSRGARWPKSSPAVRPRRPTFSQAM
jgi:S1-C subfamily serine protease